ncbi:resolvase [Enterobacter sp. CRENT-193]|nr:resolvase [Enterobacter sp. CRENT-193]
MQQSLRRHAHLALVHTSIEHSRDWCRSLLILNCQELAAQQPLRPINWCSRLLKMTLDFYLQLSINQKIDSKFTL